MILDLLEFFFKMRSIQRIQQETKKIKKEKEPFFYGKFCDSPHFLYNYY